MKPSVRKTLSLLLIVSLVLVMAPSTTLAIGIQSTLASSNSEFVRGQFGLTGLTQSGGVQLVPIGKLKRAVTASSGLCQPLGGMGTAVITSTATSLYGRSSFLYTVGGLTPVFQASPAPGQWVTGQSDAVCYTGIKDASGALEGVGNQWFTSSTPLPIKLGFNQALSLRTSTGTPYLYSLGGMSGDQDLSISTIYRSQIDEFDGEPGAWSAQATQMPGDLGRHGFAIASYTAPNGTRYIYVLGGARTFLSTGGIRRTTYWRDVYRATLAANGTLSAWTAQPDIPLLSSYDSCVGLIDSQAVTFPVFDVESDTVTQTLYLIGGSYRGGLGNSCTDPALASQSSADVYRATINPANGNLTWDSGPGPDPKTQTRYTLPTPLNGHGAVGYNQKIYVAGGFGRPDLSPTSETLRDVFNSYALGDQSLASYGIPPSDSNFLRSPNVLPGPRTALGVLTGYYREMPILYFVGGRDTAQSVDLGFSNSVYYSIPTVDEELSEGFASAGVYQSEVFNFRGVADPQSFSWTSQITSTNHDIEMSYRIAGDRNTLLSSNWIALDGQPSSSRTSGMGSPPGSPFTDTVSLVGGPDGQYFQYRAILRSPTTVGTPVLKSVRVTLNINGFPNLVVQSASMPAISEASTNVFPTVVLANEPISATLPALPLDINGGGTFYVDVFAYAPGMAPVAPYHDDFDYTMGGLSNSDLLKSRAFAVINKAAIPPNESYSLPSNVWRKSCVDGNGNPSASCPAMTSNDWKGIFNQEGAWTVIIVVDSGNNVTEGDDMDDPGERFNFYAFTVDSTIERKGVYLPLIRRA